jgi:hypothetical protein
MAHGVQEEPTLFFKIIYSYLEVRIVNGCERTNDGNVDSNPKDE